MDKARLVGSNLCQGKNEFTSGGVLKGLFLAPKMKYCLTVDKSSVIEEHKTFKGFIDTERMLDCSQGFKMIKREKSRLCCLEVRNNHLILELSYQRKWDLLINVTIKNYVETVIIKLTK